MTGRLLGKTCFVTGAGQGIGRAIVEAFASEGADVIAADLCFSQAPDVAGVTKIELDVTDEAAVAWAAEQNSKVSVLVNCVGFVTHGSVLDASLADFDRGIAVNVRSMFLTTRAFLPAMLERRNGSIVNIASVVSSVMAAPDRLVYSTSKAAVIGLTMSVARDFIGEGIRCNSISPGTIESPSLRDRFSQTGDAEAARAAFVARQPIGRLGQAEEIAATAILLASDEARFMTGSNLIIDGGMSL